MACVNKGKKKIMKKPLISVIMSTYNEEAYIEAALESIVKQSFENMEIIIFDDCSTDLTVQKIKGFQDSRIQLFCNEKNCGLTCNLNRGLRLAKGKYIARMDGDDISEVTRFEKQIAFLEENPDVFLISCHVQNFGESDLVNKIKGNSEELRCRMLVRPVYAHPGFMMRRELIEEGYFYDESFKTAQDYEFAVRVAETHKIGMVPEILLHYRVHKKQVSNLAGSNQRTNADRVREMQMNKLGVKLTDTEEKIYSAWAYEKETEDIADFLSTVDIIDKIVEANKTKKQYETKVLEQSLKKLLYTWMIRNKKWSCIVRFPQICGYKGENMLLFLGEVCRTIKEKVV